MITIRAFIGIDFDSDMKKYILEIQQKLRKLAIRGRWKHSDNFHLTLKFLDEISVKQQEQIEHAMAQICSVNKSFNLGISGLGAFDGRESIRVAWIGLSGDIPQLKALQGKIENALAPIGFLPEKRSYTPHITIGQDIVFENGFDDVRKSVGEVQFEPAEVKKLYLFKSEQVQNKRIYTKVSGYEFGADTLDA